MPMYNSIKFSEAYSKTSGSLCQYYRDEPAIMELLLIFLMITTIVLHSNLNKNNRTKRKRGHNKC